MKILNIFLFILLANTTYRCAEDENTIDCNSAVQQMLGRWEGASNYTQPSSARGVTQQFAINVHQQMAACFMVFHPLKILLQLLA